MATTLQIEKNVKKVIANFSSVSFIFDLLLAYEIPKATVTRLRTGDRNKLDSIGEVNAPRVKLFFKVLKPDELHSVIDTLAANAKLEKKPPRFIIVTDYETLLAVDTKMDDTLDINIKDLAKHYDFFLPLAGMEKAQIVDENPADVKAAEKMAKLYDEIVKGNETKTEEEVHSLNVFLTRLLFCYFAEDSNIFKDNQFTNAMEQHTQTDGSDLDSYLDRLFDLLNTQKRESSLPEYLKEFPYVNGGLFAKHCHIPKFTTKSRRIMIEIGSLDWSKIHPDIFGSMIQAVITPEHRGGLGMHYTSVPNIMKVIEPLFLDDLHEAFEASKKSKSKLTKLHQRLTNLKIFDPACGSGNFLIIAYKELRILEMKIYEAINALNKTPQFVFPEIKLTQFYGIELDDFAHEVAILSLWLAEHQMNLRFFKSFGRTSPALPLQDGGHVVHGNAARVDWEEVCPKEDEDEIYILGNPPYLGSSMQNKEQKEDKELVFSGLSNFKNLDYIACWFMKGANYIENVNVKLAFVTTNSISQGEQVAMLWPHIFKKNIEIFFAHQSFKWTNNAKGNAGVTVAIIGLRNINQNTKYLFVNNIKKKVKNINSYLVGASNILIKKSSTPISKISKMVLGDAPKDGGNLILLTDEKDQLIKEYPQAESLIKSYIGAFEYINMKERYCLWITDNDIKLADSIPNIKTRTEQVRIMRLSSPKVATQEFAKTPHRFVEIRYKKSASTIIVPNVSSERREYVPIGFLDGDTIIANSASAIYDAEAWIFALIISRMHMTWMRTVAGRLKTDYRYSSALVYNTFPFPEINGKQKEQLSEHVFQILDEREKYSEKTLAQLYDPDKMPEGLKEAHHQLDLAIERCYRKKPFSSDEERLEYLFGFYEEMIRKEDEK